MVVLYMQYVHPFSSDQMTDVEQGALVVMRLSDDSSEESDSDSESESDEYKM